MRFKLPPFLQDPFPPLKLASLSSFQMNHSPSHSPVPTQNVIFSSSLKTFPWSTLGPHSNAVTMWGFKAI